MESSSIVLTWKQTLEDSLDTCNYQPVLDAFQRAQGSAVQEELCLKTSEFAENIAKRPFRAADVFYCQKVLLFLHLCRKDPAASEKIEVFCKTFSSAAGLDAALREAADVCFYIGKDISQAERLYQRVLNASANTPEGIWAQRGLVMTALEKRDFSLADTYLDTLLNKYLSHPQIETAVRVVADRYFYANKPETAGRLYEWLSQRPASQESIWALRGLAMAQLRQADYAVADASLERLQKEYSGHPQYDLALREAADEYFYWGHNPLQAQSLYRQVLESRPEGSQAIWAQQGLILTAIELGDMSKARVELQNLLAKYGGHQQIATAVRIAADRFFYFGNAPGLACSLYERILQDWPDSPETMAARRGLAMVNAHSPDAAVGTESAEKLLTDFAGQPGLELQTAEMLQEYCRAGRTKEVLAFSEKILNQNPSQAMRLTAYTGLAQACIQLGQEEQAGEVLRMLLKAFSEENLLERSLFVIGEEYYLQGGRLCSEGDSQKGRENLNRAIEIWEMIPQYSTDSKYLAHALYYTAAARQQLGQYEQATECYQELIRNWPRFEHAWNALYQIAVSYDQLCQKGILSYNEARQQIAEVCGKLDREYPNSKAANAAALLRAVYAQ